MSRLIDAAREAAATAKCECIKHALTAPVGRWECLECGAVHHVIVPPKEPQQ